MGDSTNSQVPDMGDQPVSSLPDVDYRKTCSHLVKIVSS